MNIFVLAKDPATAAQYHCDKHVVKMILESAQLLSTAHHICDGDIRGNSKFLSLLCKPTHVHHPCAVWARQSRLNYLWLWNLMYALINEYRLRYSKEHAYVDLCIIYLQWLPKRMTLGARTPFVQCMPPQYKSVSAVTAYRNYYRGEKREFAMWRPPAKIPTWFNKGDEK